MGRELSANGRAASDDSELPITGGIQAESRDIVEHVSTSRVWTR